jgi:hypothetical protein
MTLNESRKLATRTPAIKPKKCPSQDIPSSSGKIPVSVLPYIKPTITVSIIDNASSAK